ncbi:exported protein of unknown function [uncultured Woeseiaceae bacterium]|uniref:Uncharacterized protein n=1 Tax=uncultured Woeseiaceae bacterium TaxID=1983305 RepID=A0A7D9H3N6_9GAMM|nr:exported protein of unknown function [uncultured Woeseiaceae bacterium]
MRLRIPAIVLIWVFVVANSIAAESPTTESIIADAMPAIVSIRADTPDGVVSGTGFLVDPSGIVVTNLHVIEGATRVAIKLHSGEQHTQIRIASFDQDRDLAILRLPGFGLPVIPLGNSDSVNVGANVLAIGNPLGLEESATTGIVSSIRTENNGTRVIQTDTAVSPGNSGGPLIDRNGEVIGVVTYKIRGGENLNFAIPINYVRALLSFEQLISLDDLARELGKADISLFTEKEDSDSLTGSWRSLTSNTVRQLRQDGDYLFGTYEVDKANGAYDMQLQSDGLYKGVVRSNWQSWYPSIWETDGVTVYCQDEYEIELTVVTSGRVEVRIKTFPYPESKSARKKYMKTCGKSEEKNMAWEEFVWVRAN